LFDIEIRPSALAILKNLPRFTRKQLSDAMINSEKIRIETARLGSDGGGLRRYKVADHRIIYGVNTRKKLVVVEHVGHRNDVYSFLEELAKTTKGLY
jgi:mRNA-degrading endonuclease RelE of RelBE toxin-antitoxin system